MTTKGKGKYQNSTLPDIPVTTPVVEPKWVDGKYIKRCENGDCPEVFEVEPKSTGIRRYCKPCAVRIRAAAARIRYVPKTDKRCTVCGEMKPNDKYPRSNSRKGYIGMCLDCSPFTPDRSTRFVPDCGEWQSTGEDFAYSATCPVFEECRLRLSTGLWLPCAVPFRTDLIKYVFSSESERSIIRAIIQNRLGDKGQVIPESIYDYLDKYVDPMEVSSNVIPIESSADVYLNL